jgi:hypothetical protein
VEIGVIVFRQSIVVEVLSHPWRNMLAY